MILSIVSENVRSHVVLKTENECMGYFDDNRKKTGMASLRFLSALNINRQIPLRKPKYHI